MATLTASQYDALNALPVDDGGMVDFGDLARNVLEMQSQYASYYVLGLAGSPILTGDLRVNIDSPGNYHSYRIHVEDAPIFVARVINYRGNR